MIYFSENFKKRADRSHEVCRFNCIFFQNIYALTLYIFSIYQLRSTLKNTKKIQAHDFFTPAASGEKENRSGFVHLHQEIS